VRGAAIAANSYVHFIGVMPDKIFLICAGGPERSSRSGSLQQHGPGQAWAERFPRPYKRAEESARLLYGDFGKAFSLSMESVRNLRS